MPATGQELGIPVRGFSLGIDGCQRSRLSACRRHTGETRVSTPREDNQSIAAPRGASWASSVTNGLGRSPGHIDLFELALRKEPEEAVVRRPKRMLCLLCSRKRLCGRRIQRPHPQELFTAFCVSDKCQGAAVRRDGEV